MPSGCRGNYEEPTVDRIAFPGILRNTYWSSENYDIDPNQAYYPDFSDGDAGTHYGVDKDLLDLRGVFVKSLGQ